MNNRRAAANYLADMRADCTTAAGAAVIAGLPEIGRVLAWIASAPLDKLREMRYTDIINQPAQRAKNTEGIMINDCKYYEYTCAGSTYYCIIRDLGGDKNGENWIEYHDLYTHEIWIIKTAMPQNPFQADSALHGIREKHLFYKP